MKIDDVLKKHQDRIIAIPGVHGIGVGANSCLTIYVSQNVDESQIPKEIEGFKVNVEKTEGFSAL